MEPANPATPESVSHPPSRVGDRLRVGVLVVMLGGAGWLATHSPQPPPVAPASAPATVFSAARALRHVEAVAREPHPMGSAAHAKVRDYLLAELRQVGLEVEVQSAPGRERGGHPQRPVHNVLARLAGRAASAQAVFLVTHYDSVAAGPGASDDGSGVAVLLETARALKAGPSLRNDVFFLLTDGEENGLWGARTFLAEHPAAQRAGLVLNFEARGHRGPVYTFETSPGNGRIMREYARAVSRPLASSLMYEIYRRLPNDTDFTLFKAAGIPGYNFAFIDGPSHYHTARDTVAALDRRSLQHGGDYALSLARHFGEADLAGLRATDAVYFDLLGLTLIHYPVGWVMPLMVLVVVGFAVVLAAAVRGGQAGLGEVIGAAACWWLNTLVALGAAWGLWRLAVWKQPGLRSPFLPDNGDWYWAAFLAVGLAIAAAAQGWWRTRLRPAALALGAMFWWLVLTIGTSLALPGASFLFYWPLVGALVGFSLARRSDRQGWGRVWVLGLTALPAVLLFSPGLHRFHVALGLGLFWVPLLLWLLLLGLLSLQLDWAQRSFGRWLPTVALLAAAAFVATGW